jgi:HEAT repeat protein
MATIQDIRRELDKDELDYPALAAAYGAAILPQLKALVVEDVPRLASKAAYLAGLLAGETSHEIVALAAHSRHDVVRVSAASAAASLPAHHAVEIATTLLRDADPGVRVRAAKSAGKLGNAALSARLREMATQDTDSHVRAIAADLSNMPRAHGTESPAAARMRGGDMTEGAVAGTMPGVETAEGAAAGRMRGADMTEGAAAGTMPGVEASEGAAAGRIRGGDMTEGAAAGKMPGVETSEA